MINRLQAKINHKENFHLLQEKVVSPGEFQYLPDGRLPSRLPRWGLLELEKWVGKKNINPEIIFS